MNETLCHAAGCIWCGTDAISSRQGTCYQMQAGASCSGTETCCQNKKCGAPDISKNNCEIMGCHMCTDENGKSMCNLGSDPNPGTCSGSGKDCLGDITRTEANCADQTLCMWCPSQSLSKRCQTGDRSCLVTDVWEMGSHLTEADCIEINGTFCNGDYDEKCIYPEPADKVCFKPGGLTLCNITTTATNKHDCNIVGCIWCGDDAIDVRRGDDGEGACWEMPKAAKCSGDESCCVEERCMDGYSPNATVCMNNGCHICTMGDGNTLCNYGAAAPICPDVYSENCFENVPIEHQTEEMCENLCCTYCTDTTTFQAVCKRVDFPTTCSSVIQEVCNEPGLDTCPDCKAYGCEWCGEGDSHTNCQQSTDCKSCECFAPVECCGKTALACGLMGCIWCEGGSTVGNYNCINADSDGLTYETAHMFTECTRTCGGGTQWRYTDCGMDNPLSCQKEYQSCNTDPCASDLCPEGEMLRYDAPGQCCMSQTQMCGINPLNSQSGGLLRKKRIIGGIDIMSSTKWPWLVVIYFNETTKCSGVLLDEQTVLTHDSCLADYSADEMIVHLGTYNRSILPEDQGGVSSDVANVWVEGDLALLNLSEPITFTDYMQPICLPNGEEVVDDQYCVVAGWGLTDAENDTSCAITANEVSVRALDNGICPGIDTTMEFCAGFPQGDGKDACTGDTGGPLMCQRCENCGWFLAGIASETIGCGVDGSPTIYAKVSAYTDFLSIVTQYDSMTYESCLP